jgi:2-hydroxy-6-oxonona-2,4-dienedioate hydrolase
MDPSQALEEILAEAKTLETPCGQGKLIWRHWESAAQRPPLVLLHGGFGSWTHWLANINQLCRYRSLWIPDLPGLGSSADLPEPHTAEHVAEILLHSIDELLGGAAAFDLAGFSFGALVGAQLAARAGSRCQHFVACGAAGFGKLHHQVELARPPGPNTPPDEARSIHHGNLRSLMFASEDSIDDLSLHLHALNLQQARFNSRKLALGSGFVDAIPRIRAHLAGIWGSRDATAGGRHHLNERRELLQAHQHDAGFHILDGVGHWVMYESPERFNELLLQELNR